MISLNGLPENEILSLVASLEKSSEHPLPKPSSKARKSEKSLNLQRSKILNPSPAKAFSARSTGKKILLGNSKLMDDNKIDFSNNGKADELRGEGQTVMFVAVDGKARRTGRRGGHDQGIGERRDRRIAPAKDRSRDDDRRQRENRRSRRQSIKYRQSFRRRSARSKSGRKSKNCKRKAKSSQWLATA